MATATEMKNKFLALGGQANNNAKTIIDSHEGQLTEYVKDQLREGKDGYDRLLEPEYYYTWYAKYKFGRDGSRAPEGIPDLHLTGSFYNLMALTWYDPTEFSIISNDKKWFDLVKKYGLDILKLSQAHIQYFKINFFAPEFRQMICDFTGAKIH